MFRRLLVASCLNAPLAVTPALAQSTEPDIGDALTEPLRDLNLIRRETPEVLQRAALAPYADGPTLESGALDCPGVAVEIETLDLALGEDVSGARPPLGLMVQARAETRNAIVGAVSGLVELPYRNLIRRISGAHRRDREMREAVQAGTVRRAFLKGLAARECAVREEQFVAVEPAPLQPISDLELAHLQLAAANISAATRLANASAAEITPDGDVMFAAAEPTLSGFAPAQMQLAEATLSVTVAATEAPLSDLALARRQLAAANAAAAAREATEAQVFSGPST